MNVNKDVKLIELPKIEDPRGNLTFIEGESHIPFKIKRVYWIYDVPGGQIRGGHAFKEQNEFIVALSGSFDIVVNDVLLIKGVRVMDGKKGLFVSMPREQAKDKKWYDTIRCLTQEVRDQITEVVLSAYKEE